MVTFRKLPSQGVRPMKRRMPAALRTATQTLHANAAISCETGMPTPSSAIACAGNTAAMKSHQAPGGTTSSAHRRTTLGGQNGANICVRVPIANADSAAR